MADKTEWKWGPDWHLVQGIKGGEDDRPGDYPQYADLALYDENGAAILPIGIDHSRPLWDADETISVPTPEQRAMIAAAPAMFAALEEAEGWIENAAKMLKAEYSPLEQVRSAVAIARPK